MTQVAPDSSSVLRDMLHIVAHHPPNDAAITLLLEQTAAYVRADRAALVLFDEPDLTIGYQCDADTPALNTDALKPVVSHQVGVQVSPPLANGQVPNAETWAVMPVRIADKTVGALWLAFDSVPPRDGAAGLDAHLAPIMDALSVIASRLRTLEHHTKLNHNQREFLRVVSHDLRTPLTSMQGFADMLESGTVGEINKDQLNFVERILSGIKTMSSLIDNIQDAGRFDPETGFYKMERTPSDLSEIITRIFENHMVPAEKQTLTVYTTLQDTPIVNVDPLMIERAVTNLVDNAIKYTPNGGEVEILLLNRGDLILIGVRDSGFGISPENQKALFNRHVRIHRKEHRTIKGSGLGLFIVRSVAHHHGGEAWVESVEGQGSTFFISIPLSGDNLLGAGADVHDNA